MTGPRIVVLLLALGAAGAAAWHFLRETSPRPAVAEALEAEHTALLVTFEDLVGFDAELQAAVADLPAGLNALPALDPKQREKVLGFSPATFEGWAGVGVDPAPGVALVYDGRVRAEGGLQPIFMARLVDRGALLALLRARGVEAKLEKLDGGLEVVTVNGKRSLVGARGDFTALTRDRPEAREGFPRFLAGQGAALADDPHFRRAYADAPQGPRLTVYGAARGSAPLWSELGDAARQTAAFYAERFPAVSAWLGRDVLALRMVATEEGERTLAKLFRPPQRPPPMARHIAREGQALVRATVNLKDVFAGLSELVPPAAPDAARMGLGMAKVVLSTQLGVSWDELAEAFTGHLVASVDLSTLPALAVGQAPVRVLGILGVGDVEKADAVLKRLAGLAAQAGLGQADAVEVAGHPGHILKIAGLQLVAVRVDRSLLLAADVSTVAAAVEPEPSLSGTPAGQMIDGAEVVYGGAVDLGPFLDRIERGEAGIPRSLSDALQALPQWKTLRASPRVRVVIRLDDGLRAELLGLPGFLRLGGLLWAVHLATRAPG